MRWLRRRQPAIDDEAASTQRIRGHFEALGYGAVVREMTDEELETGVLRFAEAARLAGVTAQQATAALQTLLQKEA